jgi:predicted nuclease with TOPRIM domain
MCDQLKTKSADVRDLIERQEKENKKLAQRIAAKKEEYEERSKRLKQLMDEVEKT